MYAAALWALVTLVLDGSATTRSHAGWRVTRAEVRAICSMTVGGRFEAKTTALSGSVTAWTSRPAAFRGRLAVDLRTLDTGVALRDEHLRQEYLEVDKGDGYADAVLSDIRLGDADAEAVRSRTTFTGTLLLHGQRREIAGQAEIRRAGAAVRVDARFPVALGEFGIPPPRYLGVGVRDVVQVSVSLVAEPVASADGAR